LNRAAAAPDVAAGRSGTMTIVELSDGIEMADCVEPSRDEMFERLELAFPEGFKIEIVEGGIHVTPQRYGHWDIIFKILLQLNAHFGEDARITSDVRIDFPGDVNGFCPDIAKMVEGAEPDDEGRFSPEDIELLVEVISRGTARNDYGPKMATYARAGVPFYLIIDPYTGKCHAFSGPEGDAYENELTVKFGDPLEMKPLGLDFTLVTEKFPRD
jgi:Uma2 family endonuclease